ncbi:MAG TPA: hypothetical protein VJ372_01470 [Pyrinomonadaceae bacterium]|jgi:hypothetical protein|nr:hypothetical protein [Pyrinomonadaceae bacterium]
MVSRHRFVAIIGLMVALLLPSVRVIAQGTSTKSDWSSLRSLATSNKLVVKLKTGKTVEGKLTSVSDSSLTVKSKNTPVEIKKEDVASVYNVTNTSATAATLIGMGMGIGAGAGAALGGIAEATDNNNGFDKINHVATAGLAVLGAGAGAITGYLVGKRGNKRVLIYESK